MYDPSSTPLPADGFTANARLPAVIHAIKPIGNFAPMRVDSLPIDAVRRILTYMRALVKQIDDAIGRLMAKLDLEETFVCFTSDHGDYAGHRGLLGKVPWVSFDDLARVPFFCSGCGVQGGRRVASLVQNFDFAPTVLEYAGLNVSGYDLDSRSLWPYLQGTHPEPESNAVFSATSMGWPAVRKGMLKCILRGRHKRGMMFDLDCDPGETHDVSREGAYQREAMQLHFLLVKCLTKTVPELPWFG
jgi:choline-sulfatase